MRSPSILSKLSDLKGTNPAAMSNLAFKCGGRSENQSGSKMEEVCFRHVEGPGF